MKRLTEDSLIGRALAWLARFVCRHQQLVIWTHVVLFVVSVLYTWRFLQFDMNRDNLVGENETYQRSFLDYKKEFPQQDDLAVVVQSNDPERNRQFVERLGARLAQEEMFFTNLIYNNDLKMLGSKALLFVPETNLVDLRDKLVTFRPFIEKFSQATNLVGFFDLINKQFRTAPRTTNEQTESLVQVLPALERIIKQANAAVQRPGTPPSPGITAFLDPSGDAQTNIYVTFDNAQIFLLSVQPQILPPEKRPPGKAQAAQDEFNGKVVARLRELVAETRLEVPGLNVGVTGLPVLDYDEMVQSQKDTTIASIVSLIICALIFVYGYNETGRPIKATICLIAGLAFTLAFAALVIGHLNILTVTFVPMLVGLAIDFGVHLITRYEEELRHGKTQEDALAKAMIYTGQGIFTGAFTTAGAFLAMGFTHFKGIQEMGIICGSGLVICLIPMMTLLPVLLLRGRQNVIDHDLGEPKHRARIENLWLQRPKLVMAGTIILCALAATQIPKVYFDYNLMRMQNQSLSSVQTSQKLVDSAGQSLLYGAVIANSADEAVQLEKQITNLTVVASAHSMAGILSEEQSGKLRIIGEIKDALAPLHFRQPDVRPVNVPELTRTLYSLNGYCGMALEFIGTNDPALSQQFTDLRKAIEKFRKDVLAGDATERELNSEKLALFQQAFFNDLRDTFESLQRQDNSSPIRSQDLPPALRNMFIGVTGKFLVQVFPAKDVWQRENQKEFIDALRKIYPNLTGMPVQLFHYTELLRNSYEQAAWYSLGAIVLLVLFHFRSLSSVVLALLPVAIGSIWLGGLMGLFGIPFNPANIMTLPLVIGIGVTNGIHILNRFAEEQTPSILARSTGKAVFVSGLTAIAGFGSLILATHHGIRSLGSVMAMGITTCMIAALTFLPALLNLTLARRTKKPSVENARSTLGQEEPR
jgi:uncharacterized protein